jgi:predicted transcriptional regulator
MARETYNPNAYLANLRNVKLGLRARTKILNALEKASGDAKTLAKESGLTYSVAMHHLKLMRKTGVVLRKESKPYVWVPTGLGQRRLVTTN